MPMCKDYILNNTFML